jgi:hypothetical protein
VSRRSRSERLLLSLSGTRGAGGGCMGVASTVRYCGRPVVGVSRPACATEASRVPARLPRIPWCCSCAHGRGERSECADPCDCTTCAIWTVTARRNAPPNTLTATQSALCSYLIALLAVRSSRRKSARRARHPAAGRGVAPGPMIQTGPPVARTEGPEGISRAASGGSLRQSRSDVMETASETRGPSSRPPSRRANPQPRLRTSRQGC